MHAKPACRPGPRRRIARIADLAGLLLRTGLLFSGRPLRAPRQVRALRRWGTTLAGLTVANAVREPDRPALIDDRGALSFAELDDRTGRLAAGLRPDVPRPRVGVLCRNHRGMAETLIACGKNGAEVLLLNTGFGVGQLRAVLAELRVDVLVADAEFASALAAVPSELRRRVLWTGEGADAGDGPGGPTLEEVIDETAEARRTPPPIAGRTIVLTSGTTGQPRGALLSPNPGPWALASLASRLPLRARQTAIIEAPLFHTWGLAALQMALAMRSAVVLHRRFDPVRTLRAVSEHRDAVLFAVPVMLQRIMELPEPVLRGCDASRLRMVAVSGAPLPGDLAVRFMDVFGDTLYNVYGSTETAWVSIAGPKELRAHPDTAGRPPRSTSVAILDPAGGRVPDGAIGRIHVANEALFEGYTSGEPPRIRDGRLSTGDVGHFGPDGLLFVDGREDGLVVSGGEKVVPRQVEDAIARMPGVLEVAVAGVPDAAWGQRLAAYVVPRRGARLTADAVRRHVRDQVAAYAVPRDVHFVPELPRNATGKVVPRWLDPARPREVRSEGQVSWPHAAP
ncbi:AMP-binding protein [Actinomadura rubrobrunea]|uniref:AMP-binding protein n=1 Tax=Actinomadura rubrobrunea TaxID=115335 RepID=UPI001D042A64|nr:AMP-binding protein [Actinomadura rubrobrunea]